jgi:hypothetical protein
MPIPESSARGSIAFATRSSPLRASRNRSSAGQRTKKLPSALLSASTAKAARLPARAKGVGGDDAGKIHKRCEFLPFGAACLAKPAGEGTGLGLPMSHDIVVKKPSGTIDVASEPGAFTEFVVTLPRAIPAEAAAGGNEN